MLYMLHLRDIMTKLWLHKPPLPPHMLGRGGIAVKATYARILTVYAAWGV